MSAIPLPLVTLVLYNIAALLLDDRSPVLVRDGVPMVTPFWSRIVFEVNLVSGARFGLTYGDVLIVFALLVLLVGIVRAMRTASATILGSMAMVVTLCLYVIEFLTVGYAATSVFLILTVIALVNTLAAVSMSMTTARSVPESAHG